jgi:hypothetical protein
MIKDWLYFGIFSISNNPSLGRTGILIRQGYKGLIFQSHFQVKDVSLFYRLREMSKFLIIHLKRDRLGVLILMESILNQGKQKVENLRSVNLSKRVG